MEHDERIARDRWLRWAVLRGDRDAWKCWYDETSPGLLSFLSWRCGGDRALAEEIAQEAWLVAVREIGRFDPAAAPFPFWLRGVAENLLRNHRRRDQVRAAEPMVKDHAALQGEPSTAAENRERAMRIAAALAALPPRYEAVLRAKYLDGASMREIAHVAGATSKSIESLLSRAREAFRRLYRNPHAEPDDREEPDPTPFAAPGQSPPSAGPKS